MPAASSALTLPPGFEQTTAISGLNEPTDVEVAPGGRVFVTEKSGYIRTYDSLSDPTAHTFADLRTKVHNFSSRGLQALAVDPDYPAEPYIYVHYVLDAPIGGTPPYWGSANSTNDPCFSEGDCLASVRVSKLRVEGEDVSGPEQVLVNDWCQQFQFHPGWGMDFGADGNLYVSGGDGARWGIWDYGQLGDPPNPCGDPPGNTPGSVLTPPTAEGGRLRAQDLRTGGDPLGLSGSLIRIDPDTGQGVLGNPMFSSGEANARRMLAHGFRNPVGVAVRPGTNDVWVADRGGGYFEELDRVPDPTDPVRNFGWPCYEGGMDANGNPYPRIRPRSDDQDLNICENLYAEVTATSAPFWAYDHEQPVVPGEDCALNPSTGEPAGNQISGLAFYPAAGSFPAAYKRALFFGDKLRNCIYAMLPGPDGVPDRGQVVPFAQRTGEPVAIEFAPGGDMLYIDWAADAVRRVSFPSGTANQAPTADAQADATSGNVPLTVGFDGTASSDPDPGDVIVYEWDLDGDGELDDSTDPEPVFTYMQAGTFTVTLRVTDTSGDSDTDTLDITATDGPTSRIDSPAAGTTWGAGQGFSFSGSGTDVDGSALPASALDWAVVLRHCAGRRLPRAPDRRLSGHRRGSFTAPDHAEPGRDRGAAHRHLLGRPDGGEDRRPRPAHRRRIAQRDAGRRCGDAERRRGHDAGHAPGGGRLDHHARRSGFPGGRQHDLPVLVVERRAAAVAQLHGLGKPVLLGHVRAAHPGHPDAHVRAGGRRPGGRSAAGKQLRHREPAAHRRRLRPGRGELPALPGGRHQRTGDEREAAPAVDHQHFERTGGARHHERLVRDRPHVEQPPRTHDRPGRRRGRDRQRPIDRVGRDPPARRRRRR